MEKRDCGQTDGVDYSGRSWLKGGSKVDVTDDKKLLGVRRKVWRGNNHLIGAPDPGGQYGETKHHTWPRQVSRQRVSEHVEGVTSGEVTRGVWDGESRGGGHVLLH